MLSGGLGFKAGFCDRADSSYMQSSYLTAEDPENTKKTAEMVFVVN
jgi:hypothetical protein